MKRFIAALTFLFLSGIPAANAAPLSAPCTQTGPSSVQCDPVNTANPLPVTVTPYATATVALTGNAAGTTGAVVGTLAAASAKTTYICGFVVSAIGGTAAVGPVTVAGLIGSSMVFQLSSSAAGVNLQQTFTPCIPASATNTAITITTTANGTATAVDVNSWGYRQ
jgi:hypothetical protein